MLVNDNKSYDITISGHLVGYPSNFKNVFHLNDQNYQVNIKILLL